MTIHIYECPTAPAKRRFIAQFELQKDNLYLVIHGPTAEIAEAKANLHLQYRALPPGDRKDFNLKGQLAALNGGEIEFMDASAHEDDEEDLL